MTRRYSTISQYARKPLKGQYYYFLFPYLVLFLDFRTSCFFFLLLLFFVLPWNILYIYCSSVNCIKALFPTQFPLSSSLARRRRITNWEPEFGPWGSLGRRRNDYYPVPDPRRCRKTRCRPVTNGSCKATSGWHNPRPIISTPATVTLARIIRLLVETFF